jgi:holo-[acyl-carrier protein] synthase
LAAVILGAGIDLVEIARVAAALERGGERFAARVFTERERSSCERRRHRARQFAVRFAAKEAGMKALGTGWGKGVGWHDFEVVETSRGLELEICGRARELGRARGLRAAWLATAATGSVAFAQVVLEGDAQAADRP